MSRIERALENALEQRNLATPGAMALLQPPPDRLRDKSARPPSSSRHVTVKPSGLLLATAMAPNSIAAEEFRKVKERIMTQADSRLTRNIFMVTSALPGEGKSMASLNLAISLAQEFDHTVLLIDADLRSPSCAKYLGLECHVGLSECLGQGLNVSEALLSTDIGKLKFLPAGTPPVNPVELFSSNRMKVLMDEIKHRYPDRFVIIDTPPVLPYAETRIIAGMADGVFIVVRAGSTTMEQATECLGTLPNKSVLGLIFNGSTEAKHAEYGYSYR
jgi:protein-tyrosine kinase